jgi:hypothetical protein
LSEIDYSNKFSLQILQSPNSVGNVIYYIPLNAFEWNNDAVTFNYKNEMIKAFHFYSRVDSFGSNSWKGKDSSIVFYNDYDYTVDKSIMLLQYTKVFKDGKRRVYRL